jgi:hypothetical protein
LKGLKGNDYKVARANHEVIRKRERLALNRRNKFFGKWKQAQHDYEYIAKTKSTPVEKPSTIAK